MPKAVTTIVCANTNRNHLDQVVVILSRERPTDGGAEVPFTQQASTA
jgi:hypothetical protein